MVLEYSGPAPRLLSLVFFIGMIALYFIKKTSSKTVGVVALLFFFLWINITYPLNIGQVEEAYTFLPILILCLYPGKLYANASSLIVLIIYYLLTPEGHFDEFVEEGITLVTLSLFSSIALLLYIRITDRMRQYKRDSYTDYLTDLPNRKAFTEDLKHTFCHPTHSSGPIALLLLDLDGFKKTNDMLGHEVGDQLLIALARRLKSYMTEYVHVYRLGGDEFTIILEHIDDHLPATFSRQLLEGIREPLTIDGHEVHLSGSIGISLHPEDCTSDTILIRNCDIALQRAKSRGKNTFTFYDEDMEKETLKRYQLELDLENALGTDQLYMVYKAKVNLATNAVNGVEALIRWQHPQLGNIPPSDFIEIAEESGLIVPLGRWVIDTVVGQAKTWSEQNQKLRVSLNVSAIQFQRDNVYECLVDSLKKHQLDSSYLEIEVTESTLIENPDES